VIVVILGGALAMTCGGVVRLHRDGHLDAALALFGGALLALAFVPVFLSLGGASEEDRGTDEEADGDRGRRGRFIRYLGLGIGVATGYAVLRDDLSVIPTSAIALGFLAIRVIYRLFLARAERGGPTEPTT
jgi:hypothetical protein